MNKLTLAVFLMTGICLSVSFAATAGAQRVDNTAVYATACDFRTAVLNFEKLVVKVRGIARTDERTVDKFEESTRRVVLYAKNPRQTSKLASEYRKMIPLQAEAERAILHKYTAHHELLQRWSVVLWYQQIFEQELAFHLENPRHGNRVQKRDKNDLTYQSQALQATSLIPPPGLLIQPGSVARPNATGRSNIGSHQN